MSTNYYPDNDINFNELKHQLREDGRVSIIEEDPEVELHPNCHVVLTMDGQFFHAYRVDHGTHFVRYGANDPDPIIGVITDLFQVMLYDEHTVMEDEELQDMLGWND